MADISASQVKDLRERTGFGMMECKRALEETKGDMKEAENLLRIRSGAKASKASARVAAEGVVAAYISADGKSGGMVEVNCETDFVAKNEEFQAFAKRLAQLVAGADITDVAALTEQALDGGKVEEIRKGLVMKLGENLSIRRFQRVAAKGRLAQYLHGTKIGVLIDVEGGDDTLGKDLAMHIAASKPVCVSKADVPAELLENERKIYTAQAAESGKPANIIDKLIEGRVAKFLAEVTLLGQPFVKNAEQTVEQLLQAKKATAHRFVLYLVGEGIEKKTTNFADEVMAQAGLKK
jgi:elongation factor Ts